MELAPRLMFYRNLKKISRFRHNKDQKSALCREKANVATLCGEGFDIIEILRHQLRKGKQRYPNVATS